jgi:hypothetical protein
MYASDLLMMKNYLFETCRGYLSMITPCITFIFTLLIRLVHWILKQIFNTIDFVSTLCIKTLQDFYLQTSFKTLVKTLVDHRRSFYMFRITCIHHQGVCIVLGWSCDYNWIYWICVFSKSHTNLQRNNTTPPPGTKTGIHTRWDNWQVLTTHNLNIPNCNHRINQERYILPDDGYMLSETCRRNDDGPLVF